MVTRSALFVFAFVLAPLTAVSQDKPKDHNAAVEAALKPAAKWPGVIKSYIGVTRLGTRIPCLVTKDDVDYGTKKTRILLVGGIDGSRKSVDRTLALIEWFYTTAEAAKYRKEFVLSAVPIANPDGWASGKGPGNLSGGLPGNAFPPTGTAYSDRDHPESHYLWRWAGMHAPDAVYFLPPKAGKAFETAMKKKAPAGVGAMKFGGFELQGTKAGQIELLKFTLSAIQLIDARDTTVELTSKLSAARIELKKRIARSPIQIAKQLSKKYGHNLNSVAYIPALALVGRVRLGGLTGDTSHLKDVEKIVAPYFIGKKPTFGRRRGGSNLSGHLIFSELARVSKDPAKRKRYIELALKAADLGFDKDGKPKKAMPYHSEMSDAVFMGCPILVAAGKLTGEKKYYDMAIRHMRFMLKLNLRKDGLHRHSPLNETAWGRGNGFPALGLALCLTDLPKDHPGFKEMLAAFQKHMAAMAKHQDYTGTWHQVVDHPESYREFTVTCMTTFAMIRGIRNGWLDKKKYEPIVKRAWTAIKTRIAPNATLVDVCTGTGKQKSLRAYYDRTAILGYDARGGAMALMLTTEMMAWKKSK